MTKGFIFDIGNVLLLFDYDRALRRLEAQSCVSFEAASASIGEIRKRYESGEFGRPEFLRQIREALAYRGTDAELTAAWRDIFDENFPMTTLATKLSARYPLYLLSNIGDIHTEYIFRRYPIFQQFKAGVYSYQARSFKPDHAIFKIAISEFGIEPAETIYIDDLPQNVAAAAECGFQALHYDFRRHEDFLQTLAEWKLI